MQSRDQQRATIQAELDRLYKKLSPQQYARESARLLEKLRQLERPQRYAQT